LLVFLLFVLSLFKPINQQLPTIKMGNNQSQTQQQQHQLYYAQQMLQSYRYQQQQQLSQQLAQQQQQQQTQPKPVHLPVNEPSFILEPFLYLGGSYGNRNAPLLYYLGITHVLNMAIELPMNPDLYNNRFKLKHIAAHDTDRYNIRKDFEPAFQFIDDARSMGSKILVKFTFCLYFSLFYSHKPISVHNFSLNPYFCYFLVFCVISFRVYSQMRPKFAILKFKRFNFH